MSQDVTTDKLDYILNAKVGDLVAFMISDTKAESAKIVNKQASKRKLQLETQYGKEYEIDYKDVLWIKTGSRWPKGIYRLLKGMTSDEETKQKTERCNN